MAPENTNGKAFRIDLFLSWVQLAFSKVIYHPVPLHLWIVNESRNSVLQIEGFMTL